MTESSTLDDRAVFMTLLKEADRHALGREALALLDAADGDTAIDWRHACTRLNAMLEPLRTRGPTVRATSQAAGIEVEEASFDESAFSEYLDRGRHSG